MTKLGFVSVGQLKDLIRGWAHIPFHGNRAHYWRKRQGQVAFISHGEQIHLYIAKCGYEAATTMRAPPLEPGKMPKCKKCLRTVER